MRSQCHGPLTSDCTDNQTCCIDADEYYEKFFKGILSQQGVNESVILLNDINKGLFQTLLDFTEKNQDKLSKSCIENNSTLPLPYELPDLTEISYAYLFHVCEKGFEFAKSLAPITGASEFKTIYVASNKTQKDLSSDIFSKITAYIEENLPAIPDLNEKEYKVKVEFQDESDGCKESSKSYLYSTDYSSFLSS